MERRFLRKLNDKVIGGVCSGLADYTGLDRSLVRILTFVAIIASGVFPGLLVYILCVIIVPYDAQAYQDPPNDHPGYSQTYHEESHYGDERKYREPRDSGGSRMVLGALLIALGVFLLARLFFAWLDWRYVFAGLLVLGGLYMLFSGRKS